MSHCIANMFNVPPLYVRTAHLQFKNNSQFYPVLSQDHTYMLDINKFADLVQTHPAGRGWKLGYPVVNVQ